MKKNATIAFSLVIVYLILLATLVFNGTLADPLRPSGRVIVLIAVMLSVFATIVFMQTKEKFKWYESLLTVLMIIVWLAGVTITLFIFSFSNWDFRF
jgi:hypothetical protein